VFFVETGIRVRGRFIEVRDENNIEIANHFSNVGSAILLQLWKERLFLRGVTKDFNPLYDRQCMEHCHKISLNIESSTD